MAKFKVGDRVRSNPQMVKHEWQGTGIVTKVITRGSGGALYHFRTDEGRELTDVESNLVAANSRACNSTNPIVQKALNAVSCNDKWIDDFHVIVTSGTPDKALVDALKKKAAAWKTAKRNFSDAAAGAAHDKAEADAMAVAKRLGARWIQQGAVLKVVMPNAVAKNDNDDSILRLCAADRQVDTAKTGEKLYEIRYGAGYIYPLVAKEGSHKVLIKVFKSREEANRSPLFNAVARK